ncbi:MAG: hypothetical protein J3Q66DRAFT_446150 [Benniella sp.]|nr:MAG: hypothetical protein J3Q66DRAFT_446150 [Benniella sp.]
MECTITQRQQSHQAVQATVKVASETLESVIKSSNGCVNDADADADIQAVKSRNADSLINNKGCHSCTNGSNNKGILIHDDVPTAHTIGHEHLNHYSHHRDTEGGGHQKKSRHFSYSKVGQVHPGCRVLETKTEQGFGATSSPPTSVSAAGAAISEATLPSPQCWPVPTSPISPTSPTITASPSEVSGPLTNGWKVDQEVQDNEEHGMDRSAVSEAAELEVMDGMESTHQPLSPLTDHPLVHGSVEHEDRSRVRKLLAKHPSVKLDWRVPEPIKAGGETLRGVLVISSKELSESELKTAAIKDKKYKCKRGEQTTNGCIVWIEHIRIDLTGVEVLLFELVQIGTAPEAVSCSSRLDTVGPAQQQQPSSSPSSSLSHPSPPSAAVRSSSGVRVVIARANSVLGTAAVKPYSLWALGHASSSHQDYSYSHGYGYRRYRSSRNYSRNGGKIGAEYNLAVTVGHDTRFCENGISRTQDKRTTNGHSNKRSRVLRRDSTDILDEVGFGAHIDKSVAFAGDQVTLDMFVVKFDLMKVVDIKVSLVETVQIFSLMSCNTKSEAVSGDGVMTSQKPRRRLVDTHVVKIAKGHVPPQSEESHANDNHLKGYYEDYEDVRIAKSLSMYAHSVEYMFVIKFFFKGRVGAFLELPIEIVSQYNHNRISTLSGVISCVSNSLVFNVNPSYTGDDGNNGQALRLRDDEYRDTTPFLEKTETKTNDQESSERDTSPSENRFKREMASSINEAPVVGLLETTFCSHIVDEETTCVKVPSRAQCTEANPKNQSPRTTGGVNARDTHLSKDESEAYRSNVARIAAAFTVKNPTTHHKRLAYTNPSKAAAPKITVGSSMASLTSDGTLSKAISSTARTELTSQGKDSAPGTGAPAAVAAVSPALPLLFDLTSAVLPSSPCEHTSVNDRNSSVSSSSSISSSISSSNRDSCAASNKSGTTASTTPSMVSSSPMLDVPSPSPFINRCSRLRDMSDPSQQQPVRTRNSSSPSGSRISLSLSTSSPQQSMAFTLAATTLSALTLLSSVGQATGVMSATVARGATQGDDHGDRQPHRPRRFSQAQPSPPRPLKPCLKKRRNSVPPNLAAVVGSITAKKKVTFAKGSTPLPSPTSFQTPIPSLEYGDMALNGISRYRPHNNSTSTSTSTSSSQMLKHSLPWFDNIYLQSTVSEHGRWNLPELQPHNHGHQLYQSSVTGSYAGRAKCQTNSTDVGNDDENDEEVGERKDVDMDMEYEEEADEFDHDDDDYDDDRETEEERIERRRQARVAWLAKYGDAFRQVYGVLPELPPIERSQ